MSTTNVLLFITIFATIGCSSSSPNVAHSNGDTISLYTSAKADLSAGNDASAQQKFSQISKDLASKDNLSAEENFALGDSNFYLENYEKAQYYFSKYLETNASDGSAICKMGTTKFHLEFYKDAIPYLQKCYDSAPQDAEISFLLARSMQKANKGVDKDALSLYQKSAKKGHQKAMLELAEIYRYNKYNSRAQDLYARYVNNGGVLKREAQDWYNARIPQVAVSPNVSSGNESETGSQQSSPVEEQTQEQIQEKMQEEAEREILMVCPVCGRLGEKDSQLCTFDGEPLEPLN